MNYIYRHPYNDRTFSQIMRHFLSFFIAKKLKITHIHVEYKNDIVNLNFKKIFDIKLLIDKTDTDCNIFNLRHQKLIYSIPDQDLVKKYDINNIFSKDNLNLLHKAYKLKTNSDSFTLTKINIGIHIRRGDIAKFGQNCGRFTSILFYVNIINKINKLLHNCEFHIYSDSDIQLNIQNVKYHINEDLLTTIHDIICSDIFIMSIGSNLSHFGALLSNGLIYLDHHKLEPCFNNKYNIYWSKYRYIISDESIFINKIKQRFKPHLK